MDITKWEGTFRREILIQCKYAIIAYEKLEKSIEDFPKDEFSFDRIYFNVHSFLIAVGNISKILWPPKNRYSDRGEELRNLLEINDDSLFKSRELRNKLEHFDEYLQKMWESADEVNFIDGNLGPIEDNPFDKEEVIRHFDHENYIFYFMGLEYDIYNIFEEVKFYYYEE